jgi:uncharacterized protein
MFISLQELELHPVRFQVDVPAGEIEYDSKVSQSSPLHTEGVARLVNRSLGEIRIEGNLSVAMEATCDRCLERAAFPLKNHFDLVYMPAKSNGFRHDEEIDEAGLEVGYYEGGGLALNDILREVVLLALPMQLVCDEACKGICAICGQNRNLRDCGCHAESLDDRWNTLRQFRSELGPRN